MAEPEPIEIALWGPSAAGKSMLVAQLILAQHERESEWEVLPTKESLGFVQEMRDIVRANNAFPKATAKGVEQSVSYWFVHRATGWRAMLAVEDRAGEDWETLNPSALARLQRAKGIVLLFDPTRHASSVEREVLGTLERLYVDLGETGKDARPVAVCLSKADMRIHSPSDLARATSPATMHSFAAGFLEASVLAAFERHLATYRFFPISSAGVRVRFGQIERSAFLDEALEPRLRTGGEPVNLMAPFLWLFHKLGAP